MKKNLYLFLLIFLIKCLSVCANEDHSTGTLIVSYQTGDKGTRLERIRFWVRNEKMEQQMYPKGTAFVDDRENFTRTVVVEDLPVGKYFLEFLIPNTDGFFEKVPIRSFTVTSNNVVKIDQKITSQPTLQYIPTQTKYANELENGLETDELGSYDNHGIIDAYCPVSLIDDTIHENEGNSAQEIALNEPVSKEPDKEEEEPTNKDIAQNIFIINYPFDYPFYFETYSYLTINSTLPQGKWSLYDGEIKIASGGGFTTQLQVRTSSSLSVRAERLDDFEAEVSPSGRFSVNPNGYYTIQITYKPTFGNIEIRLPPQIEEVIQGELTSDEGKIPTIPFTIDPRKDEINWRSPMLPPGNYTVRFQSIQNYEPLKTQHVRVKGQQIMRIFPEMISMGTITVNTNFPDATYELRLEKEGKKWTGEGTEFNFSGLPEGTYFIKFFNDKNKMYLPPEQKRVFLGSSKQAQVRARYEMAGELIIVGDINRFKVLIKEVFGQRRHFEEHIDNSSGTVFLPEGKYTLNFVPFAGGKGNPNPIEVKIKPLQKEEVSVHFPIATEVETKKVPKKQPTIEYTQNELIPVKSGSLIVDSNPSNLQSVEVNAFTIGKYEVTNEEFARWLNEAYLKKEIVLHNEGELKHTITDKANVILCKIQGEGIYSQIAVLGRKSTLISFEAIPGKGRNPVTYVSWYGAKKYCEDNGFKLPSENEWEKAAGMSIEGPDKKYLYAFSSNEIDRTWANYRFETNSNRTDKDLTTPVGFYNGTNKLPLILGDQTQKVTHDAISPVGAYDMSGNVWEWVDNGTDDGKVVKGGGYSSPADNLRVNSRLVLKPDHTDQYTGFRVSTTP